MRVLILYFIIVRAMAGSVDGNAQADAVDSHAAPPEPPRLCVKDLFPQHPLLSEAYITDKSWRRASGQSKVFVKWNEWSALKTYTIGLKAETGPESGVYESMKGREDLLQSDMPAVKAHLANTIKYLQLPKSKIAASLQELVSLRQTDPEDDDAFPDLDGDRGDGGVDGSSSSSSSPHSSSSSSRKRPRRSTEAKTRDYYVAELANNATMH